MAEALGLARPFLPSLLFLFSLSVHFRCMEEAAWAPLFEVEASRVAGDGGEKLEPVAVSGTGDIKILF